MLHDDRFEVYNSAAGVDKFYGHYFTFLIWKQKSILLWEKIHYDGTHTFSKSTNCIFAYLMVLMFLYSQTKSTITELTARQISNLHLYNIYHTGHVLDCTYTCILYNTQTFYTKRYSSWKYNICTELSVEDEVLLGDINQNQTVWRKTNLMHNLFLVYFINLNKFWAYLGPLSGGTTVCIQQLVLIILFRWQSVVLVGL